MKTVLIAGAGKSSSSLIEYMLKHAKSQWQVVIMDSNAEMIHEKLNGHPRGRAAIVDLEDDEQRQSLVRDADLVISLMPPHLHILLAKDCLQFNKHLITASYASEEMRALDREAKEKGLMFMCEMGLDPGIDHMSAMRLVGGIRRIGGTITSFKSSCGGLVAPESDDNPWHYKFSWNPQNVILAGRDGAQWLENAKKHALSYHELFHHPKRVNIEGIGTLAAYMNRDSYPYMDLYDVQEAKTFFRATLRYPSFVKGWAVLVQAGLTDTEDRFSSDDTTYADWVAAKSGLANDEQLKDRFQEKWNVDKKDMKLFDWLRIFENRHVNTQGVCSSAEILESLLKERWKLRINDKDMAVMQHQIEFDRRGRKTRLTSTMIVTGENKINSAMAKTVGLPMAILAKKILMEQIKPEKIAGIQIPVMPMVYVPILKELEKHGIEFIEQIA